MKTLLTTTLFLSLIFSSNNSFSQTAIPFRDNFDDNIKNTNWKDADYDTHAGTSLSEVGGETVIDSNGGDTWLGTDEYSSRYITVSGNFTVTVKVLSQENTNAWAKTGIMVRNDMSGASSAGYSIIAITPGNGFARQSDSDNTGNLETSIIAGATTYPCWLRIDKSDTSFNYYYSTDGSTFTKLGTSITLSSATITQDVGMFVTSHASGTLGEVHFDNWEIYPNAANIYGASLYGLTIN